MMNSLVSSLTEVCLGLPHGSIAVWCGVTERLFVSLMCSGGVIGSPGASAFWYTAMMVPCMVPLPSANSVLSAAKNTNVPFFKNGGTHRPRNCLVFSTTALARAEFGCTRHSNLVHWAYLQASCSVCHGEQSMLIQELGRFLYLGVTGIMHIHCLVCVVCLLDLNPNMMAYSKYNPVYCSHLQFGFKFFCRSNHDPADQCVEFNWYIIHWTRNRHGILWFLCLGKIINSFACYPWHQLW